MIYKWLYFKWLINLNNKVFTDSRKTWKALEFYFDILQDWKVLVKDHIQVLENPGNPLNSSNKVFRIYVEYQEN